MFARMRLLIVDDERVCLEDLRAALKPAGYEIDTATNISDALELFRADPHDCVITDFRMPEGDGVELLNHLPRKTNVIIISGYGSEEIRGRPGAERALAFLAKPVNFRDLVNILDALEE